MCGNQNQTAGWSDKKKWWMDLVKSLISFGLITGVTVTFTIIFLNRIDTEIELKRFKIRFTYEYDFRQLERFERNNGVLISLAYDAYREYIAGKTRETSDVLRKYKDDAYDNYYASWSTVTFR